jgi:hypothetical protein
LFDFDQIPTEPIKISSNYSALDALRGTEVDANIMVQVQAEMLARAVEARHSISAFFEFVMRDEIKHEPMVLAPHQKVLFDFVLDHDRAVIMIPISHSKTFAMVALALWMLGSDPTSRGAIVSATQTQSSKLLKMIRDYIETSEELKMVFPNLVKSTRDGDPWTQTEITVDRPPGMKDASVVAIGINGSIQGSRIKWFVVDDILNQENVNTKEQRDKVHEWFDSSVLNRLDFRGGRGVMTNFTWHPDDLPQRLKAAGWATLRMDVYGDVEIFDDAERRRDADEAGIEFVPWDHDELRPATSDPMETVCRLVAHDPDETNSEVLWPERINRQEVEKYRRKKLPHVFNREMRNMVRDDATARCQLAWIEQCKKLARDRECFQMVAEYHDSDLVFTGVDLAIGLGEENDDTAFFTFAVLPGGYRRILDVERGKLPGPQIIDKIFEKQKAYGSVVRVENNACFDPMTRVWTMGGWKYISQIEVGDLVFTHKERFRRVTEVLHGVSKIMCTVRAGGREVRCSPNHAFYMLESLTAHAPEWISVGFANAKKPLVRMMSRGGKLDWRSVELPPIESFDSGLFPVFNLKVDEDESYVAEQFVVHNAQDFIRQFALQRDISLPLKPHTTGRAKADPAVGVESLFIELFNGAWLIPNSKYEEVHPTLQTWIAACLYYVPAKHTDDLLMASYFAREQARHFGCLSGGELQPNEGGTSDFMMR